MKIHPSIFYLIAIASILGLSGCLKDKETTPSPLAMLTSGTWIGTAAYEDGTNKTQEFADQGNDIRRFEVTFNSNGRVTSVHKEGRPENGTWKFTNNNNSILFMENTPHELEGEIIVLTNDQFRVKNETVRMELHFVKKNQ